MTADDPNQGTEQAAAAAAQATEATEQAIQRIRELNERFIESAKAAGNVTLEAYEKSLQSLVDFEEKAAGATQLDWVSGIASAHAKFIQDVSNAYVSAAREMLK
jgi:hypothetical protein